MGWVIKVEDKIKRIMGWVIKVEDKHKNIPV